MPQILFHEQLTSKEEVLQHQPLIRRILSGAKANICKLVDIDYLGHSVFRVYTNNNIKNERRLIYSYVTYQEREIFMVLTVMEDHDYDKLKRKLCNIKSEEHQVLLEIEAEPDEIPESSAHELLEPLELLPAASSQGQTKIFDENEEGGSLLLTPLIVEGPPGTGKSRRIHTLMIRYLSDNQNPDALNSSNPLSNPPKILLLTPTLELTEKHQELFQILLSKIKKYDYNPLKE